MAKHYTDDEILEGLRRLGRELGITPAERHIRADPRLPSASLIKLRFGSVQIALTKAGFAPPRPPPVPTRSALLDNIRIIHARIGRWPAREDIDDAYRAGWGLFSSKRYFKEFGSIPLAVALAGGPQVAEPPTRERLLDDIRRVATLELEDKPAGVAPSHKHFKDGGIFQWSIQAFRDHLGDGGADDWVRQAGLTPRRLRSANPAEDIRRAYLDLYATLGRLPDTRDVEEAGLDFSGVARHFGGLKQLRLDLGLPLVDRSGRLGLDGWAYSGRNSEVADVLFSLLGDGRILDYEPEVRLTDDRLWTADFVVTTTDDQTVYVEMDGFNGQGRPVADYTVVTEKLRHYASRQLALLVASDTGFVPAYGEGVCIEQLAERFPASRAVDPRVTRPMRSFAGHQGELEALANACSLAPVHVAWLAQRRFLGNAEGALPDLALIKRWLQGVGGEELLSVEAAARELGFTRRVLDRRIEDGSLAPDHVKGGGTAYFLRRSLPLIREVLGESIHAGDRSRLLDEVAAAERAGISTGLLRKMAAEGEIVPAERRLCGGWLHRFYLPEQLDVVARTRGATEPPAGWLTVSELALRTGSSRTQVLRLVREGIIHGEQHRTPGTTGGRCWYFPPTTVEQAVSAMPRVRKRCS